MRGGLKIAATKLRRVLRLHSKGTRITIGVLLVLGGLIGFLPFLGFWMIPLGMLVLSYDVPIVRHAITRFRLWWRNRRRISAASTSPKRNEP